jgi:multidrug efflux system outer membrane protein
MIRPMTRPSSLAVLAGLLLTGCAGLEPTYQRPAPPIPATWPAGPAYSAAADSPVSDWRQVFTDPRLRKVIEQALADNRDLRVAIAQIQASRAEYHVQRAELLPTLDSSVGANRSRSYTGLPAALGGAYSTATTYSAGASTTSYELDLFGRVRSLTKSALETYLATDSARRSTQISLVAEVATDYLTFAADASLLEVSKTTVASAKANFDLARRRLAGGVASALDVSNAETILDQAEDDVARYTTQLAQDKNALDLVVGAPVAAENLPSGVDDPATRLGEPPASLTSQVLLQRPDVVEAEHTLRGANANIGAARAAFFPQISLTGSGGVESASLSKLFSGRSGVWSFAPTITLPIFAGGANVGHLDYAKAEARIDVAQYEKAIQTAFREASDALAQRGTITERLRAQRAQVAAATQSLRLAEALYARGSDSYLDVLTAQRTLYSAQQSLISVELLHTTNIVTLYKVLGGALSDRTGEG